MAVRIGTVVAPVTMKWHVAVAVGLPVVVGVGYWFLIRKNKNSKAITDDNKDIKIRELSVDSDTSNEVSQKHEEKDPFEEATLLKEEGNKCFKSGKYEEAINFYTKAIEISPKVEDLRVASFYQNKAAAYEQLKNYEEVKKACTEALRLYPRYIKALFRRAKAYEHTKELALAFEDLTSVCILENFQSQSTLIAADTILSELIQQNVKEAMEKRVPTLPSNYFIKTYFSAFMHDPIHSFTSQTEGDFSKGFLKAVDCMKKEDYESVIPACTDEILEEKSLYKNEALVLRGTFYQLYGNYEAAKSDLETVIDNEKVDPQLRINALIKRAYIHIQSEEPVKCFKDFDTAVKINNFNSDIYHHRGQINLMNENIQDAARDFQKVFALQPNYSVAAAQKCYIDYRRALRSRDEMNLKEIFEKFEQLIRDYPKCGECYSLYAQVLSSEDKYEKSNKMYKKALKVDPKNSTFLVSRAVLILKWTADVNAAVKILNEALELDDKCLYAYETLGTIEVQRGNLKRGVELFEKAVYLAKTEVEMSHFFSLKNAAEAQTKAIERMNLKLTEGGMN